MILVGAWGTHLLARVFDRTFVRHGFRCVRALIGRKLLADLQIVAILEERFRNFVAT